MASSNIWLRYATRVDAGTSILLSAQVRDDFRAETAFDAVVCLLQEIGLPRLLTCDRDPRWVGSQSGRDFPSALRRFLLCVGVEPNICPPKQPQKNAFVERYHRSFKYESILVDRPATLAEAIRMTEAYQEHYNWQRPHQGKSCGNLPPRVAFPELPRLPTLPTEVDPDRWLDHLHGQAYLRQIGSDGCVTVDLRTYYIGTNQRGKTVALLINAPLRQFEVWEGNCLLKRVPIKGLAGTPMKLEQFIDWVREQAIAEERRGKLQVRLGRHGRRLTQMSLWDDP